LLNAITKELRERQIAKCPFDKTPDTNEKAFWTRPELVAHVRYSGWTNERRLRHPVFIAMREDAQPQDCRWEGETPPKPAAAVIHAHEAAAPVLTQLAQIEAELTKGKRENVTVELDGKRLRFSHLNKVYFPEPGYTKRDLLYYYYHIAVYILPFSRIGPWSCGAIDGVQATFRRICARVADWFDDCCSSSKNEKTHYPLANFPASLFLTNLGCIDHNPWSSRADDLEHPDYFFFDLDPSEGATFSAVLDVGRALCQKLEEIGLSIFLKPSGATGLHLYMPVERGYTYKQLRALGDVVAHLVARDLPKHVTFERTVARRLRGSILIDVDQNSQGRPLAAPYAVRAFPQAPVSAPITLRELRANLHPEKFNLKSIFARIAGKGDLWADFWKRRQTIELFPRKTSAAVSKK
jgi:bifunctional non-homologous end joining protein LigD